MWFFLTFSTSVLLSLCKYNFNFFNPTTIFGSVNLCRLWKVQSKPCPPISPNLTLSEGLRSTVPSPDMTLFAPSNLKAARREWDPFSLWDSWGIFEILKQHEMKNIYGMCFFFHKTFFRQSNVLNVYVWNVSCISWRKLLALTFFLENCNAHVLCCV